MKPSNNKSSYVPNVMHNKNRNSISESLSTPMLNKHDRSLSKPDQLNSTEFFLNPFTNPVNSHTPFGMASPSVHNINFMNYEPFANN